MSDLSTSCQAILKNGNPCRYRKKPNSEFCGVHANTGNTRDSTYSTGVRVYGTANEGNSAGASAGHNPDASPQQPADVPDQKRCTNINRRGIRCKRTAPTGGICTYHYNLSELNNMYSRYQERKASQVENPFQQDRLPVYGIYTMGGIQQQGQVANNPDDQAALDEFLREVEFLSLNYRQPIPVSCPVNDSRMNMKTLREHDCDICALKNRMVMLYCCRQEMCADCMQKITNYKCPFCKQDNHMKMI